MTRNGARLGVGMIGYAFMGAAHSQAWRNVNRFFDLPLQVDLVAVAGRSPDGAAAAASRLGWRESTTDWRSLLSRDDVAAIDICTPGDSHPELAIAALEAGKHVLCEKPLANTIEEAETMAAAAEAARENGVHSMVGFNYRRVPALAFARQLIVEGRLGVIRHVRAQYLQDFLTDPEFPLVWRLQKERAGTGALGDIGAHIVDLAHFLLGEDIIEVAGMLETFIEERPTAEDSSSSSPTGGRRTGPVTVDDCALFLSRFASGAVGTFEATRFASGRKNALRLEVNGSEGSVAFDFEAMNELQFHDHTQAPELAGFRKILVTEAAHPYLEAWWPPGHGLGYEHTFVHETRDFVAAVATDQAPTPSFDDGLQVQRVLAGVERSAHVQEWQQVARRDD